MKSAKKMVQFDPKNQLLKKKLLTIIDNKMLLHYCKQTADYILSCEHSWSDNELLGLLGPISMDDL